MDLSLTEEQQLLQDSARDFLRQECPTTHVRAMEEDRTGYSPELWQKMTEVGWAGMMCRGPWDRSGPAGISVPAVARNEGFVIDGAKRSIANAHTADTRLVAVRSSDAGGPAGGISLLLVPGNAPGIEKTPLQTIAADRQFEVEFRHVEVGAEALLGQLNQGWGLIKQTIDYATVAKCSEMVGIAQVAFDMAVDYAKNRVQFGRPIGSFQAIKHKCADMVIDVDGSRFITYRAAWCLAHGIEASKEIAMAKAWT